MRKDGKFMKIDGRLVWVPTFDRASINNNDAIDFIIREEGFLKEPTALGDGKITIGSGLTDPKWIDLYKARGNKWSAEDNKKAVAEEVQKRREWSENNIPNWHSFSPNAQNALLSYRYNYNYTRKNSPKLFEALDNFNLFEAARQMDATSSNGKFKNGLSGRRQREQNLFVQDYVQDPPIFDSIEERDAIQPLNPYTKSMENIVAEEHGPYKDNYGTSISEKRAEKIREAVKARHDYDKLMEATSLKKTSSEFKPKFSFDTGGFLEPEDAWDVLSMSKKAEIMKIAINNGIYNLDDIRKKYNEFAEGGSKKEAEEVNTEKSYFNTMERVAEENYKDWGFNNPDEALLHALNDNTYDYRGFYTKHPQSKSNASTHWTDEFKTVYHPTFSNESIYSGKKSQYNPNGRTGGFWLGENLFIPAPWQLFSNYAEGGKIYIKPENRGKFTALKERTGHSATWFKEHGTPAQKKMAVFALNSAKWKHGGK